MAEVSFGGGVRFDPFEVIINADGCRWSRFADFDVFEGKAAAAQAGGSFAVTIKKGDRTRSIRLDGADGAPRVRVTAPGGQVLESPEGPGTALTPALRILRSEQLKATVVGLHDPKPGTYKFDLLPGSPAITKVSQSVDPPPARVSARVTGRGAKRTLVYDVLRRPDQRVTFVEVGPGGQAPDRDGHRRPRNAQVLTRPGDRPAADRSPVRAARDRRRDEDRRLVHAARRAARPARAGVRPPPRQPAARGLDARSRRRTLRGRDHAHQRRAAHHADASRVRHDQPRRPFERWQGDRPRDRFAAAGPPRVRALPRYGTPGLDPGRAVAPLVHDVAQRAEEAVLLAGPSSRRPACRPGRAPPPPARRPRRGRARRARRRGWRR